VSYYLKYRPQKVDELDLTDVRVNLLGVLKGNSLSHANLFVGPRGSGKTSAARILSMAVNCKGRKENTLGEPCGKCKVCKGIKDGSMVDVLEMDAASHRGIDDIRNLKERIKLSPVSLEKKVYIIDEVHMLTREAFNALLKVLEEPPKHVMFFLCTTELHKVPETIISRCSKVSFTKATKEEVVSSLMKAVKGEKLKIDKEAVELLACSVDGSFREGHKLLEQLSLVDGRIGRKDVSKILGLAGKDEVLELLKMSLEGRVKEIGGLLMKLEKKGVGVVNLLENLLSLLREMIREKIDGGADIREEVKLAGFLIESAEKIKVSPLPFLPIELALLEVGLRGEEGPPTTVVKPTTADEPTTVGESIHEVVVRQSLPKVVVEQDLPTRKVAEKQSGNILSLSKIEGEWGKFLDKISTKNRSVAGLLRASKPKLADGNSLTVEVFYEFHKSQLEQDSKRLLVEEAAEELWGPTVLRCVLGEKQVREPLVAEDRLVEVTKEDDYVKAAEDVFGN
jgi:DNA polymerase III subunit gamma/tau